MHLFFADVTADIWPMCMADIYRQQILAKISTSASASIQVLSSISANTDIALIASLAVISTGGH